MASAAPIPVTELRNAVRQAGLRATPSRMAVLALLHQATSPLTHAEVAEALDDKALDRATIYRNLTDLAEAGLLRRADLGDHVWRFEIARPAHAKPAGVGAHAGLGPAHPHFMCTECGEIECLPDMQLTARRAPKAVKANRVEVQLRGVCDNCE